MRRIAFGFGSLLVLLLVAGSLVLYTLPFGSGEYRSAPNGSFCAEATSYTQRRLFASARQYQAFSVRANACEQAAGITLWKFEYEPGTADLLDYGARDRQFISWAAASDQVVFVLDAQRSLTVPVP